MSFATAKELKRLAIERRDKYASKVFEYEAVKLAMTKAASAGAVYYQIKQEIPANLQEFEATKQLIEKLKDSGYKLEWIESVQHEKIEGRPTGAFIRYDELRISWGKVHITNAQTATPEE